MSVAKYIFFSITLITISDTYCVNLSSLDDVLKKGMDAYIGQRWTECIIQFEEVLHLYKLYKGININCNLRCTTQDRVSDIKEDIEDLKFYEIFIKRNSCQHECKKNSFLKVQINSEVSDNTLYSLQNRKPYEFLHMCYFEMYVFPKAASASFTYLVADPTDSVMLKNIEYYMKQPEIDINEITDLESDNYAILYKSGKEAYAQNNWKEAIANMEEVITDYLVSEDNCRAECNKLAEQEWCPDYISNTVNNIKQLLQCKQKCQDSVQFLAFKSGQHFLADVLNYLQISYYHLNRVEDAARSVASYLFMFPNDEDMIENKRIYSTLVDSEMFIERHDIFYYSKRDLYEKYLLNLSME